MILRYFATNTAEEFLKDVLDKLIFVSATLQANVKLFNASWDQDLKNLIKLAFLQKQLQKHSSLWLSMLFMQSIKTKSKKTRIRWGDR